LPFHRPQEYIVCWPGDERAQLKYDGLQVVMPAMREVAALGTKHEPSPFRFAAAVLDGRPIPGTVRLTMESGINEDGVIVEHFNPENWLKGLYDVNEKLFARGLSVVVEPHEVAAALENGRPLWIDREIESWEAEVANERLRRKAHEERGEPVPPLSLESARSLKRAVESLEKYRKVQQEDQIPDERLFGALSGETPQTSLPTVPQDPTVEAALDAPAESPASMPEKFAALADDLWRGCKEAGISLKTAQKTGLLDRDPAMMQEVMTLLEAAKQPPEQGESDG
jgi:hypothetical protein